jgi:predicted TIM-barrel fold metal-dependent hydrolase
MRAFLAVLIVITLPAWADPYTGPIFDAHLHYNDDARGFISVGSALELFSKNGVKAIIANSRPNDGSRALYEAASARQDLKVIPFIRVYRDRDDYGTWFNRPEIHRMIVEEEKRGIYRGVGEFHVYGARDAGTAVVRDIVNFAVAKNLVLHAHCDEEALEALFAHNPKARVIWAHTGFSTPLARVDELLRKYPELRGELSYRSGVADTRTLEPEWKALFTRYPDRFLLGSDTWVNERWQSYPSIMGGYRAVLGELPRDVAGKIAWQNGAKLFGVQ